MRAWLVLCLAVCVAAPPLARAQEVVEAPEIVVEEAKEPAPEQQRVFEDRPVATEVLPEETIRELPATTAVDVVNQFSGVRTQSRVQGEEAVVSIEGLPPEYTRILVDGRRYSGGIGGVDDLRDVPIHALERVEIQRGAHGIRNGGEGAGGVIEFRTRRAPEHGVHATAETGAGSDGKILVATASEARVGPVGLTLSALHDQIRGFESQDDATFSAAGGPDSRRVGRDLYGTATWSPAEPVELHSRVGWRREHDNVVPIEDDVDGESHPDPQRRDYHRWLTTNGFEWSASEATRVRGDLGWYGGWLDSEVGRPFRQDEAEWRANVDAEHHFETGPLAHALTAGLDLRRPTLDLTSSAPPPGVPDDIGAQDVSEGFRTGALFLEDEISLFDRVSLLGGLRAEVHSEFGFDVLPQVALLVQALESLRLRASWGDARRAPTLVDLYQPAVAQLDGAYFLAGNPDLETESSRSWRAGFEWTPRPWIAASVTGFWNEIDDAIRSVRERDLNVITGWQEVALRPCPPRCGTVLLPIVTPAPLFRKENLDQLRTRGFEADLRLRLHPRVDTRIGYTFLETKVVDSNVDLDELPNSPRHVIDATVTARVPRTGTTIAATASWRSSAIVETSGTGSLSFADPEQESDPSLLVGMRVTQPVRENFDVYVDLQNVLNEPAVDSYAVRGFTFFVGVRAEFDWAGRATP